MSEASATSATTLRDDQLRSVRVQKPWLMAARRFRRNKLALAGLIVFALLLLLAVAAPLVAGHDPNAVNLRDRNQGPSLNHLFGTDRTGRDTFARTIYAGRVSLSVGVVAVAISLLIGTTLGAIA